MPSRPRQYNLVRALSHPVSIVGMRSGGWYEHFAKRKSGKKEVSTRSGIRSINLPIIFIVKCPEPNTTKNSPFQHIGFRNIAKERRKKRAFNDTLVRVGTFSVTLAFPRNTIEAKKPVCFSCPPDNCEVNSFHFLCGGLQAQHCLQSCKGRCGISWRQQWMQTCMFGLAMQALKSA